jgi:hypothetical protein
VAWSRRRIDAEASGFFRRYTARRRQLPNDRSDDRELEQRIKRMSAADLNRLLNGDEFDHDAESDG